MLCTASLMLPCSAHQCFRAYLVLWKQIFGNSQQNRAFVRYVQRLFHSTIFCDFSHMDGKSALCAFVRSKAQKYSPFFYRKNFILCFYLKSKALKAYTLEICKQQAMQLIFATIEILSARNFHDSTPLQSTPLHKVGVGVGVGVDWSGCGCGGCTLR